MRGGVILIVVALFVGYMGVSGKYKCFTKAFDCLLGDGDPCGCDKTARAETETATPRGGFPTIAPLQPIQPIGGLFG